MRTFLLCLASLLFATERGCCLDNTTYDPVQEDASLSMTDLVNKYGYPIETHRTLTDDGYILTLYRIPFSKRCPTKPELKVPVLLQHGLLLSSFDWVILGPEKSLGYILADACYDVWLGNNRGNSQSRMHILYSDKNPNFWGFSWHEMGVYDVPAMINYILHATQKPRLHYVGHSEGTTQFFVFSSLFPEYYDKVISFQALSPVVFMKHVISPIVRMGSLFEKSIQKLANSVGLYEFAPESEFLNHVGAELCTNNHPHLEHLCKNSLFLLSGFDDAQLNKTVLPAILGHTPSGSSARCIFHYFQIVKTGKFSAWDYGVIANLKLYESKKPPLYNLDNVIIPTVIYFGKNDWLATVKDVRALIKVLPNVIEVYEVPYPKFSHTDFIFATNASALVYDKLLQVLARFKT